MFKALQELFGTDIINLGNGRFSIYRGQKGKLLGTLKITATKGLVLTVKIKGPKGMENTKPISIRELVDLADEIYACGDTMVPPTINDWLTEQEAETP